MLLSNSTAPDKAPKKSKEPKPRNRFDYNLLKCPVEGCCATYSGKRPLLSLRTHFYDKHNKEMPEWMKPKIKRKKVEKNLNVGIVKISEENLKRMPIFTCKFKGESDGDEEEKEEEINEDKPKRKICIDCLDDCEVESGEDFVNYEDSGSSDAELMDFAKGGLPLNINPDLNESDSNDEDEVEEPDTKQKNATPVVQLEDESDGSFVYDDATDGESEVSLVVGSGPETPVKALTVSKFTMPVTPVSAKKPPQIETRIDLLNKVIKIEAEKEPLKMANLADESDTEVIIISHVTKPPLKRLRKFNSQDEGWSRNLPINLNETKTNLTETGPMFMWGRKAAKSVNLRERRRLMELQKQKEMENL